MGRAADEEDHRLEALRGLGILDTVAEPDFDRLTRLAATVCEAPIACIGLVDAGRVWFKAVHGAAWQSIERSSAFCTHTIAQRELFVVEDARADPRFAALAALAGEPGLCFYAGVPLVTATGHAVGTLAVLDRVPRRLSLPQAEALRLLAAQVMAQIESCRQRDTLQETLRERDRSEAELAEDRTRWRRLFAASATGITSCDENGRFVRANPAFCALVGRDEAALLQLGILDITHPDDRATCWQELQRLLRGDAETSTFEKRYVRPDGSVVWSRAAVGLTPRTDQQAAQFVAVVQDIDAQKAAQERLRQSHALIQLAGRMAGLGGWAVELPQREVSWSEELLTILDCPPGYAPGLEETLGWYTSPSRERIVPALEACIADGTPFDLEVEIRTARGRRMPARVIGEAVRDPATGQVLRAQGALLDQSERKRAERVLRESEERFRSVARATADAVWDWSLPDDHLWWNEGMQSLFGYAPEQLATDIDSWTDRIHPDDLERVTTSTRAVIDGGGELWSAEYRFRRGDGSYATVLDRGFVIRDAEGRALRMVGGMTDLSTQREADARIRQQAALLDEAQDAIIVRDLDDRITYWNRSAQRIFGWSAAEVIGRRVSDTLKVDPFVAETMRSELAAQGQWAATVNERRKDGSRVTVDVRWTLLHDAAGQANAILSIQTDVTRRVELEAQLQQASRLEAVGQLTGGVAHDFNNLLTVILGNADLLAEQLSEQPLLRSLAEMTRTAAERGAELTQRLLAFARRQALQPQSVDAHQLLVGMDGLLRRTLPENIELELVRAAGQWPALVDPVQLESAVLNLVLNARDAMPQGGKITVETHNASIDLDYADRHADVLPGQYVMLSVSDTGVGMTPEQLARAFEPFYTTKGAGRGSGLGLSMVYGLVKQSRGHITLYSELGQGTTVRLYLPRADGMPDKAVVAPRSRQDFRGNAIVLVVEDDELVRRHATGILAGLGYQVLDAESGPAALAILRERDDIELLFTDVVMPGGLNGRQLADAAIALRPALKVLYTSGYTENAIVHHGRLDRGVHLLSKPYRGVDLARKVQAVLTQAAVA